MVFNLSVTICKFVFSFYHQMFARSIRFMNRFMKKIASFFIFVTVSLGLHAQATNGGAVPREILILKETTFDFGKIQQGRPVTHEFAIANDGQDTLKLENVQASCGCTTPVWKKDPVAPGGSATINVGYNASAEGPFEKPVTIYYNGGQTKMVTIKGNVYKLAATSAPQNSSIELLKQTNN